MRRNSRPGVGLFVADVAVAVAGSARLAPVMVRYLDGRPDRSPDLTVREVRPGDRYLLCSDGLSAVVAPGTIREVLTALRG